MKGYYNRPDLTAEVIDAEGWFHTGDIGYADEEGHFFIVLSGSVRISRDGRAINLLGPGDFLGEIALLDGGPRTATATLTIRFGIDHT